MCTNPEIFSWLNTDPVEKSSYPFQLCRRGLRIPTHRYLVTQKQILNVVTYLKTFPGLWLTRVLIFIDFLGILKYYLILIRTRGRRVVKLTNTTLLDIWGGILQMLAGIKTPTIIFKMLLNGGSFVRVEIFLNGLIKFMSAELVELDTEAGQSRAKFIHQEPTSSWSLVC